jgi:hypothetical protein
MKKLKKGDIVTPFKHTHRFTFEKEYKVESVTGKWFVAINDKGFKQECYIEDFTKVEQSNALEMITAVLLIVGVLFASAVVVASYLFEGI